MVKTANTKLDESIERWTRDLEPSSADYLRQISQLLLQDSIKDSSFSFLDLIQLTTDSIFQGDELLSIRMLIALGEHIRNVSRSTIFDFSDLSLTALWNSYSYLIYLSAR